MQLRIVVHDVHFNQPANIQRVYLSKKTHDKTSATRNICILMFKLTSSCSHSSSKSLPPLFCRWCTDPAYPIRSQRILVAHAHMVFVEVLNFGLVLQRIFNQ